MRVYIIKVIYCDWCGKRGENSSLSSKEALANFKKEGWVDRKTFNTLCPTCSGSLDKQKDHLTPIG